jgi:hypothetical protein
MREIHLGKKIRDIILPMDFPKVEIGNLTDNYNVLSFQGIKEITSKKNKYKSLVNKLGISSFFKHKK